MNESRTHDGNGQRCHEPLEELEGFGALKL